MGNDRWTELDAEINEHNRQKKSKAEELAQRSDTIMKTFEVFRTLLADYVPIAKRYNVKCREYKESKKKGLFFRKTITYSIYDLGRLEYESKRNSLYGMYYYLAVSEIGEVFLSHYDSDDDGSRWINQKLTEEDIAKLKGKIDLQLRVDDDMSDEYGYSYSHVRFPQDKNYIFGTIEDSLIRLTYHFSRHDDSDLRGRPAPHCIIHWDKPRTLDEIREIMQEFFVYCIRESKIN